jgi:glycogen synthase
VRILVISNLYPPDFLGGYELGCSEAVEALRRIGHDVKVLTSVPSFTPVTNGADDHVSRVMVLSDIYRTPDAPPTLKRMMFYEAKVSNFNNTWQVMQTLRRFRPQVVYLFNILGLGGLAIAEMLEYLGVPCAWHLMDRIPAELCTDIDERILCLSKMGSSKDFSSIQFICCSQVLKQELETFGIALGASVSIIPNWFDDSNESDEPPKRTYWSGGPLKLIYAGVLSEHKGAHIVLEAAKRLADSGFRPFSIDFYGSSVDQDYLALARRLAVAEQVAFHGRVSKEELALRFRDHDALVFPTWQREPFGFVTIEAAAQGCVPIFTRGGGASEAFTDGVNSLQIERDPEALAKAIMDVAERRVDLQSLGASGIDFVRSNLKLETIIRDVEKLLLQAARDIDWEKIDWSLAHRTFLLYDRIGREMAAAEQVDPGLMAVVIKWANFAGRASRSLQRTPLVGYLYGRLIDLLRRWLV